MGTQKGVRIGAAAVVAASVLLAGASAAGAATPDQAAVSGGTVNTVELQRPQDAGVRVVAPLQAGPQQDAQYSVKITSSPNKARAATQVFIKGSSTGFANGNWLNAWIIRPDGSIYSAGGNWVKAGSFALPISFPSAGNYRVQLSLGQYPAEQYSQIVPITVTKAAYDSKPVLVEEGFQGQRYLHVNGTANVAAGKEVYIYVVRPGTLTPRLAGTAEVQTDGSYQFTTATSATNLDRNGHYTVVVARSSNILNAVGVSTYYNIVYRDR